MPEILVTGMPGTGKTTFVHIANERGEHAIDIDDPEQAAGVLVDRQGSILTPGQDHSHLSASDLRWHPDRTEALIAREAQRYDVVRLAGVAANFFYPEIRQLFSDVVFLDAPADFLSENIHRPERQNPYALFENDPVKEAEMLELVPAAKGAAEMIGATIIDVSIFTPDEVADFILSIR